MRKRGVGRFLWWACVIALVAGVGSVLAVVGAAHAAEVATETSGTTLLDKVRCSGNAYAASSTTRSVRMRCFYDGSRSWTTLAGTDLSVGNNVGPSYVYLPEHPGCTGLTGTYSIAVGPQAAGDSLSGVAIPALAFEASYTASGGTCTGSMPTSFSIRLRYTGTTNVDQATCSYAAHPTWCTWGTASAWPAWGPDWFSGGGGGLPAAPVLTCTRSFEVVASGKVRVRVTPSWTFAPAGGVTWTVSNIAGVAPTLATISGGVQEVMVTTYPDDGRFYVTVQAAFVGEYTPGVASCVSYVDLDDPGKLAPEEATTNPDDGYGCPSGWGLLNPSNILKLAKCLFIPPEDTFDEVVGDETTAGDLDESDSDTLWYPIAIAGAGFLAIADEAIVTDGELGECHVLVRWGTAPVPDHNYTTDPGRDAIQAFGAGELADVDMCPSGSSLRTGYMIVRYASGVMAAWGGLWMAVGFVRRLGTYKGAEG